MMDRLTGDTKIHRKIVIFKYKLYVNICTVYCHREVLTVSHAIQYTSWIMKLIIKCRNVLHYSCYFVSKQCFNFNTN